MSPTEEISMELDPDLEKSDINKEADKKLIDAHKDEMINYSRRLWSYLGYSGSRTPWHDNKPNLILSWKTVRERTAELIRLLEEQDISLEAYSMFILTVAPPQDFEYAAIYSGRNKKYVSWIKKLRVHAGTSERLDLVAAVLLRFIELQVEAYGVSYIDDKSVIRTDQKAKKKKKTDKKRRKTQPPPKCLDLYHRLADRVLALNFMRLDPFIWLDYKFWKIHDFMKDKDSLVNLNMIVHKNGFEPRLELLKSYTEDAWKSIRQFLGLSRDCEFPDGYIPKGWGAASDDRAELDKVVRVTGFGYYFYADGTQRRGKRHYASNSYFVIKCTPDNFEQFKDSWHDPRLISAAPTWGEYSTWGASVGWWDEQGNSVTGRGRSVKWRKNGPQKSE